MARAEGKNRVRKPCAFLYGLATFCTRIWFTLFYGLRIDRSGVRDVKGPLLLLCNHESNYDFLLCAIGCRPRRFNFMVTTYFYHSTLLARTLRLMGCIPKKQFVPDAGAIKSVLEVVHRGGDVCIFPEGQVCYSGATNAIDPSIAKLVKKLGVTTAVASVRGNYLSFPKWACGKKFPARVEWSARVLFTPEQLARADVDEVGRAVLAALRYDDYEWQRERMIPSRRPRTAQGLETVLYRCPKCGRDRAMCAQGDRLVCEKCGYTVALDRCGFFVRPDGEAPVFDSVSAWFRYEQRALEDEIDAGGLPFSSPCILHKTVEGRHGYTRCGEGEMTLDAAGIHFKGTKDGAPFEAGALYEHQTTLTHNAGLRGIDVPGAGENYLLSPLDGREMFRFIEGYTILHRKRAGQ
ncbi:MAG: 1-acyl-sn-glycerol-3-phosphate acyltransferase [Oscillospiraceae bacterium]|nr:1-acyl-sn-glycerol-3-phosphate acyltransferase [Oscillospiraceae bacterium]